MGAMHGSVERLPILAARRTVVLSDAAAEFEALIRGKIARRIGRRHAANGQQRAAAKRHATSRRQRAAVMLHLRSCYVSKAAILTALVQPVPVENRSPS
jgi:hypothetical protein